MRTRPRRLGSLSTLSSVCVLSTLLRGCVAARVGAYSRLGGWLVVLPGSRTGTGRKIAVPTFIRVFAQPPKTSPAVSPSHSRRHRCGSNIRRTLTHPTHANTTHDRKPNRPRTRGPRANKLRPPSFTSPFSRRIVSQSFVSGALAFSTSLTDSEVSGTKSLGITFEDCVGATGLEHAIPTTRNPWISRWSLTVYRATTRTPSSPASRPT